MNDVEMKYKRETGYSSRIGFECERYRDRCLNVDFEILNTFDDDEGILELHTPEYVKWLEEQVECK